MLDYIVQNDFILITGHKNNVDATSVAVWDASKSKIIADIFFGK
jgi:hypothetical protein